MTGPHNTVETLKARIAELEASERETGRRLAHCYRELAASVEREAAFANISRRINEPPLDVDGTLQALTEAAMTLTDSDASRVWLREDNSTMRGGPGATRLANPALLEAKSRYDRTRVSCEPEGRLARIFTTGTTEVVDDLLLEEIR